MLSRRVLWRLLKSREAVMLSLRYFTIRISWPSSRESSSKSSCTPKNDFTTIGGVRRRKFQIGLRSITEIDGRCYGSTTRKLYTKSFNAREMEQFAGHFHCPFATRLSSCSLCSVDGVIDFCMGCSLLVEMANVCAKEGNVEFASVLFMFVLSEVARDCLRDFVTLILPFMVLLLLFRFLPLSSSSFSLTLLGVVLLYFCNVSNIDEPCEWERPSEWVEWTG